jgi:hypothetical protein
MRKPTCGLMASTGAFTASMTSTTGEQVSAVLQPDLNGIHSQDFSQEQNTVPARKNTLRGGLGGL